jgi:hypothetical protein
VTAVPVAYDASLVSRLALSLVLAAAVALVPFAPPVHVHGTIDEAGHHEAVAHAHAEAHREHVQAQDDLTLHVEDEDSVVTTLDPVFITSPTYVSVMLQPAVAGLLPEPPVISRAVRAVYVERLNHSPPRGPTVVRGPPTTIS